jgi:hypothetical protein
MKERDKLKAIQAANFIWSVYLVIMLDALLLRPSLNFTTLHPTKLHVLSFKLHPTIIQLLATGCFHCHRVSSLPPGVFTATGCLHCHRVSTHLQLINIIIILLCRRSWLPVIEENRSVLSENIQPFKPDSHIPCRSPAALKANSHIPCRSPAALKANSHIPCRSPTSTLPRPCHTPTVPRPSWKSAW